MTTIAEAVHCGLGQHRSDWMVFLSLQPLLCYTTVSDWCVSRKSLFSTYVLQAITRLRPVRIA